MSCTKKEKLYTLTEACELLSISTATGRNWMKSGRLVSAAPSGKKPAFKETALLALKEALSAGAVSGLKGRRNKSCLTGTRTYHSYIAKDSANHAALQHILETLEQNKLVLTEKLFYCLLRDCAEKLLIASGTKHPELFADFLKDLVAVSDYAEHKTKHTALFEASYTYIPGEDTLGFLYLSLCSIRDRKFSGSYYTPARLVKRLVTAHLPMLDATRTVFDPSCGTGIFLLQLPHDMPLKNIYGNDLNAVSITLTRINLALKYQISTRLEADLLYQNITVSDFLKKTTLPEDISYDIILGNPPWGASLTAKEKKLYQETFSCAQGTSLEIYDLFIEQSLTCLSSGGILSFVLPESLLTVKSHTAIRKLLLQKTAVLSVESLGEAFEQVHCPSIILTLTAGTEKPFFKNVMLHNKNGTFSTQIERIYYADSFTFFTTDEDYLLLHKILSHPRYTTLVDRADFALGIVTGNNAYLLKQEDGPCLEPVVKGTDISKYHINSPSGYLHFSPEQFQQTAPEHFYRAPEKLFYRFINKQLIFAYDDTGLLSLNSCNILIPRIPGLSIKYILAILNSSVAQFVFEKKFHSVKILRSHLEQIPIPLADAETQAELIELVDFLMSHKETSPEYPKTFALLDRKVAELFFLTAEEFEIITS